MRTSVQKLFLQLYVSVYGTTERYMKEVQLWKRGRKKIVKCMFTRAEYIEFSQMWEWHRKNYLAERKRMRELFQIAYYDKFKMYASETCDEFEAQRKKKDNDLTFEDILAINMMAAACKNKSSTNKLERQMTTKTTSKEFPRNKSGISLICQSKYIHLHPLNQI